MLVHYSFTYCILLGFANNLLELINELKSGKRSTEKAWGDIIEDIYEFFRLLQ